MSKINLVFILIVALNAYSSLCLNLEVFSKNKQSIDSTKTYQLKTFNIINRCVASDANGTISVKTCDTRDNTQKFTIKNDTRNATVKNKYYVLDSNKKILHAEFSRESIIPQASNFSFKSDSTMSWIFESTSTNVLSNRFILKADVFFIRTGDSDNIKLSKDSLCTPTMAAGCVSKTMAYLDIIKLN